MPLDNISVSSVGEALIAMEEEIKLLESEATRLLLRLKQVHTKQAACVDVIKKLLTKSVGGVYPPPCPSAKFPELHNY